MPEMKQPSATPARSLQVMRIEEQQDVVPPKFTQLERLDDLVANRKTSQFGCRVLQQLSRTVSVRRRVGVATATTLHAFGTS